MTAGSPIFMHAALLPHTPLGCFLLFFHKLSVRHFYTAALCRLESVNVKPLMDQQWAESIVCGIKRQKKKMSDEKNVMHYCSK